jgi:hypothetical protein
VGGQAAARIAAMAELGAKRGMSKAERRLAREQEGEEDGQESEEEEPGDVSEASEGKAEEEDPVEAPAPRHQKRSPATRKSRGRRGEPTPPAEESEGEGEAPAESAGDPDLDPRDVPSAGLGGLPLPMFEAIRIPRAKLESWAHEPFLERVVVGALVRVTVGQPGAGLYRAALVCGVDEAEASYSLGARRTNKVGSLLL